MAKLLFTLLMIGSSGGTGLAIVSGWLHYKLYTIDGDNDHKAYILIKSGMALVNGVIIYALANAGEAGPPNIRQWLYVVGITAMAAGLAWQIKNLIVRLSKLEGLIGAAPEIALEQAHRDEASKHVDKEEA